MKTQIVYDEFFPAQEAIQSSCASLAATKPSVRKHSSTSKALDAFMDRLGQFETMKQQYEELLETDSASLLKAGLALQVLDASIASGIAGAAATVTGNSGVSSVDSIHATYDQVTGDDMSRAYKRA